MLKSIDTFNRIIEMKRKLTGETVDVLDCWKDYISPYQEIEEKCLKDALQYNFDTDIRPIIVNALTLNFSKIEIAHNNSIKELDILNERFYNTFAINDDIFIYFYIGLCNGAGWATTVNSQQTILLGVEKIVELNWHEEKAMIALIYHELCHIAHSMLRNQSISISFTTQNEKSIWQLYVEGFAQRYEQILYKDGFYHQDKNGWLRWCTDNHDEICREYLYRIKNNLSTQCFFGDWVNFKGYSDVGYYLGCEFIKYISNNYSTMELANIEMCELRVVVINYLERF